MQVVVHTDASIHICMTLNCLYYNLCNGISITDGGTLCYLQCLIRRHNISKDVSKEMNELEDVSIPLLEHMWWQPGPLHGTEHPLHPVRLAASYSSSQPCSILPEFP